MAVWRLGIGLIVDNAIVVLENIVRLREKGENAKESALTGTRQVAGAIMASTLTTMVIFLPVVFMQTFPVCYLRNWHWLWFLHYCVHYWLRSPWCRCWAVVFLRFRNGNSNNERRKATAIKMDAKIG